MKISIKNSNYFNDTNHFLLKRNLNHKEINVSDMIQELNHYNYSLEDIHNMNVILNNNDCSDSFFQDVCSQMEEDGFSFQTNAGHLNKDIDNATIITLDMQYNASDKTLFFAPYNNTRIGYSDSLVLAMQAAFQKNGSDTDVLTGKVGFRKDEDGNILHIIPTEMEEDLDENANVSFVTISLGANHFKPEVVAKSIEEGLIRQKFYLDHFDTGSDLIYRADAGEDVGVVADYFGASVHNLCEVNHIKDLDVLEAKTIINPNYKNISAFDIHNTFQYNNEKNKTM